MNRRTFLTRGLKAAAGLAAMVALPQRVGAESEPDTPVMRDNVAHDNGWAGISTVGVRTVSSSAATFLHMDGLTITGRHGETTILDVPDNAVIRNCRFEDVWLNVVGDGVLIERCELYFSPGEHFVPWVSRSGIGFPRWTGNAL